MYHPCARLLCSLGRDTRHVMGDVVVLYGTENLQLLETDSLATLSF